MNLTSIPPPVRDETLETFPPLLGMARFLLQFEQGNGDYTRERRAWLKDKSVQTVAARLHARKKGGA